MAYTRISFGGRHRMINDETNIFSWFFRTSPIKWDDFFSLFFMEEMIFKGWHLKEIWLNSDTDKNQHKFSNKHSRLSIVFRCNIVCVYVFLLFSFLYGWIIFATPVTSFFFLFCFFRGLYFIDDALEVHGIFLFSFHVFCFFFFSLFVVRKNCNRW